MKTNFYKIVFCVIMAFLLKSPFEANAQISNYVFSQSNGIYIPITGGISLGNATTTNDEYFVDAANPLGGTTVLGNGLPIGFTFNYNGAPYDKFGVNANGWIVLGNGFVNFTGANLTVPINGTLNNVIAAFGRDLQAQTGCSIRFETIGNAPNRVLVVQWDRYKRANQVSLDSIGFQIRLNEADGSVNMVYGKVQTASQNQNLEQVGIKGTGALDVALRTSANSWIATSASTTATATCNFNTTVFPPSGLTFSWVIPLPCTVPPTAGIATVSTSSSCAASKIVSLNGSSTGSGISLQWLVSPDDLNWTPISGATTLSYQVSQSSSNYYACVVTCSGIPDTSTSVLVTGSSSAVTCYCTTNLHGPTCQAGNINNLSISSTTLSNQGSGCASLSGNSFTSYTDTGNYTATLLAGLSYSFNVTSTGNGTISLWIDYNQNGVFEATEWTQLAAAAVANAANSAIVNIPVTALSGKTGMRIRYRLTGGANAAIDACTQFGSGETEDYLITIGQQAPCTTPIAGIASSSASGICPGVNYTLQLTGNSVGSGLAFQWQSSADSLVWTNINGANNAFLTTSASQKTFYRCYLTCGVLSDTSNGVAVLINPATLCYCSTTLHNNTNCNPAGSINDVTISGTSLSNLGTGCASTTAQSYSSYAPLGSNTASLDIGAPYNFNVTVTNAGNTISLWIDYNQNGQFEATEWTQVSAGTLANVASTKVIVIPVNALPGQTGMRIRTRQQGGANAATDACTGFASGETEDYIITLVQQLPCVAPPTAGLAIATDSTVCGGVSFTVSLSGASSGAGLGYGWQSSTDNVNWVNTGSVAYPFFTTTQNQSTYYRCVLNCSGMADTSSVVLILQNPSNQCYCTSSANQTSDTDIGNVTFGTLNNGVGTPATQNPTAVGNYSDFTSLPPQPYTQNTSYPISLTQINSANFFTARAAVFIDYNQNGSFTDLGETVFTATTSNVAGGNTVSGTVLIPATAVPGTTRMRVIMIEGNNNPTPCGTYQWGETEDYLVNIIQQLPCIAPPTAGLTSASDSTVCAATFTLSLVGASSGSGMTYVWQSSSDSIQWNVISAATSTFYSTTQNQSTYYRCILTCSGLSDTSTAVYVVQNPLSGCYCASSPNNGADTDIGNVTFGALNNGLATPVVSNPAGTGTYTDYTGLPPQTYNQNTAYAISVSQITSNANFFAARATVFIDYNQNGVFTDAGERVLTGTTSSGVAGIVSTVSGNILIPATASLGLTRMRVILAEGAGPGIQNPCGTFGFGETEDYIINIDLFNAVKNYNSSNLTFTVYPNPSSGNTTINYSLIEKSRITIDLFNVVGEKITRLVNSPMPAGNHSASFDLKQIGVKPGSYFIKITGENESKTVRLTIY